MKVVTNMIAASAAFIVVLLRTSRDDVVKWMFMKPCPNKSVYVVSDNIYKGVVIPKKRGNRTKSKLKK